MLTYRYDLDMVPGGVPVIVNVSQYDNAFSIEFHLYSRTGSLDLSDVDSAAIRGKKLDGHAYSADAAYDNGVVTVTGHVQMTAISGKQTFEITLYDYVENELNSANFILNVEDAPMDQDDIESDSVIRELINVTSRADKIIKAASDAEAWAVGQRDGVDVDTDDEAYHNNAKYYRDASISSASAAATSASQAASSASAAASSAQSAGTSALAAAASAREIEDLTVAATTLSAGASATVNKTTESGHYKLTFGIPKGEKGDRGLKGDTGETGTSITSVQKTGTSGLVDTYTITFSNGETTTFTVTNGRNGTGAGSVISVGTGAGLTGGPITESGTIKAKMVRDTNGSIASATPTETAGRQYPVVPDSSGNLSVNVPWVDTQGDSVSYTPSVQTGTKLGDIEINGNTQSIYAPAIPTDVSDFTNDAGYQDATQVAAAVDASKVLQIDIAAFSSLPQTVTNASITEDMVVVNSVLGTPSAQTGTWTVTTGAGTLTVSGSISGSTTLTLYLEEKM